jgi:hypothetical protein
MIEDCVGNKALPYTIVPIHRRNDAALGIDKWRNSTQDVLALSKKLSILTPEFSVNAPEDINALPLFEWPLLAAWLNMLDGRFSPYRTVDTDLSSACGVTTGGTTLLELLLKFSECVSKAGDKAALVGQLAPAMISLGILGQGQ